MQLEKRQLTENGKGFRSKCFEIQEDMVMGFEGRSCNITDSEGNPIPNDTGYGITIYKIRDLLFLWLYVIL